MEMSAREIKAIEFTIGKGGGKGNEGGFSNRKNDKGGATFSGFTIGTLRRLSAQIHGHNFDKDHDGDIDVDDLKKLEYPDMLVMADTYYNKLLDQLLDEKVAIKTFDFGFNCGTQSGVKLLQRAINKSWGTTLVKVDGVLGPKTVEAANTITNEALLLNLIQVAKDHYHDIVAHDPTQQEYLKGWLIRAEKLPH